MAGYSGDALNSFILLNTSLYVISLSGSCIEGAMNVLNAPGTDVAISSATESSPHALSLEKSLIKLSSSAGE